MYKETKIPETTNIFIEHHYERISPIVYQNLKMYYLRKLYGEELYKLPYTTLNNNSDLKEEVDFSVLTYLTDIKMLHKIGPDSVFKPTVAEIIKQIPSDIIDKVVAFEIITGPVGIKNLFNEELKAGYYVSIVRLYQNRGRKKLVARPVTLYPSNYSNIPIGMTKAEIKVIKLRESILRTYS